MRISCMCPDRYSIEPHGDGYALYYGRCNCHHGYNLVHLVEPSFNCDFNHLEKLLNLGMREYEKNPDGANLAE
jgi:hypothetical protein